MDLMPPSQNNQPNQTNVALPKFDITDTNDTGWVDLKTTFLNTALADNFDESKYGRAQLRKFPDGRVKMRGLLIRLGGVNWAANDLVLTLPISLTPRTERRFNVQTTYMRVGDRTTGTPGVAGYGWGKCLLDAAGSSFIVLDMVDYYIY